jgi:hypothetical protein
MDKPFVKTKDRLINLPNVTRVDLLGDGCTVRFVDGDEVALAGEDAAHFVKALRKYTSDDGMGARS